MASPIRASHTDRSEDVNDTYVFDATLAIVRNTESGWAAEVDVPSWCRNGGYAPKVKESGADFAKRVMDERYGPGNYKTGPGSEYSKVQKWGDRGFQMPDGVNSGAGVDDGSNNVYGGEGA